MFSDDHVDWLGLAALFPPEQPELKYSKATKEEIEEITDRA